MSVLKQVFVVSKLAIFFGLLLLCLVGGLFLYDISRDERAQLRAPLYSEQDLLESLWYQYTRHYIEEGTGRTLDRQRDDITTSEGQAYTMLRAVWMDDKETFDAAWRWTKDNLRKNTFVFAWKFGERADGTYGVLHDEGGNVSATDGDVDIATALFLAYGRWGDEKYLAEGRELVDAIWTYEVIEINGLPYILANDLDKGLNKTTVVLNPSYYAPYAYRMFAFFDPQHDWDGVVHTSYDVLLRTTRNSLGYAVSSNLPPNWVRINTTTGVLLPPEAGSGLDTDYGYDAIRTPWRLALDYQWFGSLQARAALESFTFLSNEWERRGSIAAVYTHSGAVRSAEESNSLYGASLPYFVIVDPEHAAEIYRGKLLANYNVNTFQWYEDPGYYADNWAWFGMAFYHDRLFNYVDFLMERE